jgi:hypothetical protein
MLLDQETLFSDGQAITADAASTNLIDLGKARDIGKGTQIPLLIQVVETFDNLTSLKVIIETDDNAAFSSPKEVVSHTALLAALKKGFIFPMTSIPRGTAERFLRLNYDVTGTAPSAGKITAGLVMGVQDTFHQ